MISHKVGCSGPRVQLCLNFDNVGYLEFFGAKVESSTQMRQLNQEPAPRVLNDGQLPSIARLEIKFQSTRWAHWTDPWTLVTERHIAATNDDPLVITEPCQTMITEIILSLALDYVHHIGEVALGGDIKYSTMNGFYDALKENKGNPDRDPDVVIPKARIFGSENPVEYVHCYERRST